MIEAVKDIKAGSGPPPGVGGTDKSADDTDDVKAALDTLAADALTDNLFTQAVTDEMIDRLHPEDHVELSTTDTLPAPFAPATPYFVVRVNDTEFKLTASLVDARAGIVIDITDDGAGVHTLTRKTQPRYTNNGILVLDQRPIDVAEAIIAKRWRARWSMPRVSTFCSPAPTPARPPSPLTKAIYAGRSAWRLGPAKRVGTMASRVPSPIATRCGKTRISRP